jgi:exonuclease SbcC
MRPLHLQLEALGPYPGKVHIDFGPLVDEGLFLIYGTTGAGKTFLLDAMTYALFGDVAGARGKHSLVSQHAEPGTEPWAELEFSVGGDRWKIRRVPKHKGRAARGDGLVDRGPTAHLQRQADGEWVDHPGGLTEVNEKVVELLGLSKEQFQQVVLLPQGDFEQVLRAKDEEREKLLTTLFDTRVFASATFWLDRQAKTLAAGVEEQSAAMRILRQRVADSWRNVDPARRDEGVEPADDSLVGDDTGSPDESATDLPADQAGLDVVLDDVTKVVGRFEAEVTAAKQSEDAARAKRTEVEEVARRWDERLELLTRRAELDDQRVQVDAERQQLANAIAAEPLRSSLDREGALTLQIDTLSGRAVVETESLRAAWDSAELLPPTLVDLRPVDTPTAEQLRQMSNEVASFRSTVEGLAERATQAAKKDNEADQLHEKIAQLQSDVTAADERLAAMNNDCAEAERRVNDAVTAGARLPGLEAEAKAAADRSTSAAQLVDALATLESAREAADAARRNRDAAVTAADDARLRLLDDMAGTLATLLETDAPCPVCGSDQHPAPAVPPEDAPTQKEVDRTQTAERKAGAEFTAASTALITAEQKVEQLRVVAGDTGDDPDAAVAAATAAQQSHEAAAAAAAQLSELRAHAAQLTADRTELAETTAKNTTAIEVARGTARAARSAADEERATVVSQLGTAEPAAVLTGLDSVRDTLADVDTVVDELRNASSQLAVVTEHLDQQITESDFFDRVAALGALRDEPTRLELAGNVEKFDSEDKRVRHGLAADDLRDLPKDRPDLTGPDAEVAAAELVTARSTSRLAVAESARAEIAGWVEEHRATDDAFGAARAEADLWGMVAKECAGNGRVRVSWQRWMLSTYLREICEFANARLAGMSSGRYSLQVKPMVDSGRAKEGLGLLVYDTHTTAPREVATLSGGETFQASLALALGVADAVTAHAGGVSIDTLFVDEGFGTLDPESLELAMDQLEQLREGGRTVGLISHVGALKERIHMGIKVTSSDQGSTAEVCDVTGD